MSNHRTPIGFKNTNSSVNANIDNTTQQELHNDAKTIALLKIVHLIDNEMTKKATGGLKHQPFSEFHVSDILQQLDKVYIKHYEPI